MPAQSFSLPMSTEEGDNNFLRGNHGQGSPLISNSTDQTASELPSKHNKKEKANKVSAKTFVGNTNNDKPGSSRGKVEGEGSEKGKGVSRENSKEEKGTDSDHEIHIWTERERRKKMRNMFSSLHDLLPQLPPKADKSTIVDEAVSYIKTLEETLQKLEQRKKARGKEAKNFADGASSSREAFLADQVNYHSSNNVGAEVANKPSNLLPISKFPVFFSTWLSPNVVLSVCDTEAQFGICSVKKPSLFTAVCFVFEKHGIEVLSAHVSTDQFNRRFYMIQARANLAGNQFAETISVEDIYRQAANEIVGWIDS